MSRNHLLSGAAPIHVDLASLDPQDRWVLWKSIERNGNVTKVPMRPDGEKASATNPQDWFARAACEAALKHVGASGIGLVLGPLDDGTCVAGIDLDNCRHNGTLKPWAQEIVDRFATYTEVSPSGSGVKLFFNLTQEDGASVRSHLGNRDGRKWSSGGQSNHPPAIELYLKGRYFTFTGVSIGASSLRVVPKSDIMWLTEAAARQFPAKSPNQRAVDNSRSAHACRVAMAMRAQGYTIQEYEDALAQHPTLAGWLREKGHDYDKRELKRAWKKAGEYLLNKAQTKMEGASVFGDLEQFLIGNLTQGDPPDLQFLLEPLFPLGKLGVLFGPGGVGKSFLALDLCLEVANILPANDNGPVRTSILGGTVPDYARGTSIFLTLEDDADDIHRRAAHLDPGGLRHGRPCMVIPASTLKNFNPALVQMQGRAAALTKLATDHLPQLLKDAEATTGYPPRLLVLDPAGDFLGADENESGPVQLLMQGLRSLGAQYGVSIILLGHTAKVGNQKEPTMRGSIAWIYNARFAYSLRFPPKPKGKNSEEAAFKPPGNIEGCLIKANHQGAPVGKHRYFNRDQRGRLIAAGSQNEESKGPTDADLIALLARECATYAAAGMPFAYSGKHGLWEGRDDLPQLLAELSKTRLEAIGKLAIDGGALMKVKTPTCAKPPALDVPGGALTQGMEVGMPAGSRRQALRQRRNGSGGVEEVA